MQMYLYDCEVYKNIFTATFKKLNEDEKHVFVIHDSRNDLDKLMAFINDPNKCLVGYNSFSYDNQLLNCLFKNWAAFTFADTDYITYELYKLSADIIENEVSKYKYNLPFAWLDLLKIIGIRKSLKLVGVNLKWRKLQELPYDPHRLVLAEQIDTLLAYNLNDVMITELLCNHLTNDITFRQEVSKLYDIDAYSESRSGISNRILEKMYADATGLSVKDFKDLRTFRDMVRFNTVVLPDIKFETEELDLILEEIRDHVYFRSKPFFKKIITVAGRDYKMGLGGIHSQDGPGYFVSDDDHILRDADVASEYPSFLIEYELYPAHLGPKFLKGFKQLRNDRVQAKHNGEKTKNEVLKISLNSAVGKTLFDKSWLCDPIVNLRAVINCQLMMLMLVEKFNLAGIEVLSANTDGVTCRIPKNKLAEYEKICTDWQAFSRLELEFTDYAKYIRRDVNNYIATYPTDKPAKKKGIFFTGVDLAKGVDKPIISIALSNYFLHDIPISKTIKEHTDIYDFCVAKKIDDKFDNVFEYIENGVYNKVPLQKVVRYYISTRGGTLLKVDSTTGSKERYEADSNVTVFNDYVEKPMSEYGINYTHYISEAQKIIDEIVKKQLTLF